MQILDRYIITRFLMNFGILMVLLFVFAVAIDLILQLDRYVEVARRVSGAGAGALHFATTLLWIVIDFHGPRIVQFYAYMIGLVAIGAMGFTLAYMHRHRELVAIMASGVSLHRVAMPLLTVVFMLNLVQLLNQELLMPRVAPMLLRKHGDIGREAVNAFDVPLTHDGAGHLLQAASFDPLSQTLLHPTILRRDDQGRTIARITAEAGAWDAAQQAWTFQKGTMMTKAQDDASGALVRRDAAEPFATDLTPEVLTMRRYGQFASMLSTSQINAMLASPGVVDADALRRYKYSRFSAVLVNMLLLSICLPFFLLREPANLLRQTVLCAAAAIPTMLGSLIAMNVQFADIPPAAAVFLPALLLIPIALAAVSFVRT